MRSGGLGGAVRLSRRTVQQLGTGRGWPGPGQGQERWSCLGSS